MDLAEALTVLATRANRRCELHFLATSERWTDSVLRVESHCKNRLILVMISTEKASRSESIRWAHPVEIQCECGCLVDDNLS